MQTLVGLVGFALASLLFWLLWALKTRVLLSIPGKGTMKYAALAP